MIKKIIIIALTVVVCVGLIIYSQKGDWKNPFDGADKEEIAYTESQTVNLPMEKVRTLNPITSKDSDTYQISKLIFESLFYLDENLSLVNGLAADYSYDSQKTSATITINPNSFFSNGDNVTAADVKYSIDNYISAAASGNTVYSSYVANIKSVSVDKGSKYSVTVNFKDKSDVSMENLIFPIVSQRSFGKSTASKVTSGKFIPVGSGPYAVKKYNDISELVLSANPNYTGVKPTNTLCFTILPEKEDVLPLLEVSNISIGFLYNLSRDTLVSDKKITPANFVANEVEVIGYNFEKEAMTDKKIRKAIAYAVDNETINESAYYKNGIFSDTIYYPGYLGTENTGDNFKFSLDKAKSLLISAGYSDRDENGYLEDREENELNIAILVNGADQSRTTAAEAIKASLDKLSVSCRIIYATDANDFNSKLRAKDFDIFVGGMKINETYDLRNFLHSGYNNPLGYSNEKVNDLLDKLKSGIGNEQKKEAVEEIKSIIIDELPYYCIVYRTYGALSSEALAGDGQNYMFNNIYRGCIDWHCKYPVKETFEIVDSNENFDPESK